MQGVCDVAPRMEHDLCRAEHVQASVGVNGAVGAEGLHHGLLAGFGVVHMVDDDIAGSQHGINVAGAALVMGAEVALVVGPHRTQADPVVLRVDKYRVILGGVVVQHGFQYLVLHLDELEGLVHAFLVLTGHDGHHVAHKAYMAVDEQTVARAGLRVGLACLGVAGCILRDIFPGENRFNVGHLFGNRSVDVLDNGVCVRRAQELDNEAVLRDHIVHIDGLAGDQLHGILFTERLVDGTHSAASFCFFHARKFMMPRSWPS